MNLDIYFLELFARINELAAQDKSLRQSFGFRSMGVYAVFHKDIAELRKSYRNPKPGDNARNRKIWEAFDKRDKEWGLGILSEHRYNPQFNSALEKFLKNGPPERMT
jgi:hypothetical protein